MQHAWPFFVFHLLSPHQGWKRKPRKSNCLGMQGGGGWSQSGRPRTPMQPLAVGRGVEADSPLPPVWHA